MQRHESYKPSGVKWIGDIPGHWSVQRNIGIFDERKEANRPDMELLSVTINRGIIKQDEITAKKDSSNDDKSKYKVVLKNDLAYNKMRMWQGAISNGSVCLNSFSRKISGAIAWWMCSGKHSNRKLISLWSFFFADGGFSAATLA